MGAGSQSMEQSHSSRATGVACMAMVSEQAGSADRTGGIGCGCGLHIGGFALTLVSSAEGPQRVSGPKLGSRGCLR